VADLFNIAYDTMLLMLLRFFAHNDESEAELARLSGASLRLMTTVLRPLGEVLCKMPAGGPALPLRTAGPVFGYNRDVRLLPHKRSAWVFFGERLWELATIATRLRLQAGVPVEIEEAAAALQDLAGQFAPTGGRHSASAQVDELKAIEAGRRCMIQCVPNGPYVVTNVGHLKNSKGEEIPARPQMALCRCGGSANKPFCDGTHARIGFSSQKLPERVADRCDTCVGKEITVFDNRGICQHSGFCTDRLASVFRLGQEPFVDPDGARKEAIIEAVKNCPSGALSYALDGVECRDEVDLQREPTITVSKNGPYRITGGTPIEGGDPRAQGSSTEHYALCRCGHSKNKPFCDGSHWYVHFEDDKN
jgi:CDGSH-type Zn-finger protein/ferredoxin